MPYNKLNISGANADVLSWVTHGLDFQEENMLRNVSRLPCLYKHVALMPVSELPDSARGAGGFGSTGA